MSVREPGFLQFFFVHEHLLRYTTTIHARVQPWWFFIAVLLVGILPWLGTVMRALPLAWQQQARPGEFNTSRFLLIWAASIVLFFSLSGSKLTPYVVPAIAPLALLSGMSWARRSARAQRPPVFFPLTLAGACIAARWIIPLVVPAGSIRDSYGDFASWLALAGVLICVTVAVAYALARLRPASTNAWQSSTALLAIGSCAALTLIVASTNTLEPARGGPSISAALRPYLQLDRPFYCVGMYPQTVIFALGKTCVLVGYHGELETQLDGGASHWLPTLHDFRERWNREPDAVAIVDPAEIQKLGQAGVAVHKVSRSGSAVVVNNPGSQNLRGAPLAAADQKLTRKNISGPRVSSAN
jgi:4-amino-4-deoxy-L-arabinose transferase-like glycosyltransferase